MLVQELFESVSIESALNSLKSNIGSYIRMLYVIKDIIEDKKTEGNMRVGRMLAGANKAKWIRDNYLSSNRFGSDGLQTAASYLATRAKSAQGKEIFKNLANIPLFANKNSGKSQAFDKVGDYLEQLETATNNKELTGVLQKLRTASRQVKKAYESEPEQKMPLTDYSPKQKQPKNELQGQQNQQADDAFNDIVRTLPRGLQKQLRKDTARMDIASKMKYLHSIMK
jgi:hypothetical protein